MRAPEQAGAQHARAAAQRRFDVEAAEQGFFVTAGGELRIGVVRQQFAQSAQQRAFAAAGRPGEYGAAQARLDREQHQCQTRRIECDEPGQRQRV